MDIRSNKLVGEILRVLRREAKLSQVQVAERLGRTQSHVSKIEMGERQLPLVETWRYARALGIDCWTLVERVHVRLTQAGIEPEDGEPPFWP